jgi:rhodanese-related sulfurtransferase
MNFLQRISLSGVLLLMSFSAFAQTSPQEESSRKEIQDTVRAEQYFADEINFTINPHGVKSVLESKNQNITLVDVRAAKNYAEGHVPGAINLPFDKFSRFEGTEKEFPELRKDGFNYVYCYELGCNLATKAARKLASLGYPVKEMKGGFNAWKDHNYPIEK